VIAAKNARQFSLSAENEKSLMCLECHPFCGRSTADFTRTHGGNLADVESGRLAIRLVPNVPLGCFNRKHQRAVSLFLDNRPVQAPRAVWIAVHDGWVTGFCTLKKPELSDCQFSVN